MDRFPKIVIGENRAFRGPEDYTKPRGNQFADADSEECYQQMQEVIKARLESWDEGIGEV